MPARKRVLATDAATAPGPPLGNPPVTMICEAQRSISVAQPIFDAKIFDVQKFALVVGHHRMTQRQCM
jgi:hypothetical protein